jgi:hypothetical protein
MKTHRLFLAIVLGVLIHIVSAQVEVKIEITLPDDNLDTLRSTADYFTRCVNYQLQRNYPVDVEKLSVDLYCDSGKVKLRYYARLLPCEQPDAEFNFHHTGSFALKKTAKRARSYADNGMEKPAIEKRRELDYTYGRSANKVSRTRMIVKYSSTDICTSDRYSVAVTEAFFATKRW